MIVEFGISEDSESGWSPSTIISSSDSPLLTSDCWHLPVSCGSRRAQLGDQPDTW